MKNTRSPLAAAPVRPRRTHRVAFALLGAAGGLAAATVVPSSAEAATTTGACVATSHTTDWKSALTAADKALGKARFDLRHRHYVKAAKQLRVTKRQALTANTAATRLIGKPPTDPESDDPPGVTAVLRVSGFDHALTMALIPLFSDPKGHHVVAPLGKALNTTVACRDRMLGRVIALKPELATTTSTGCPTPCRSMRRSSPPCPPPWPATVRRPPVGPPSSGPSRW